MAKPNAPENSVLTYPDPSLPDFDKRWPAIAEVVRWCQNASTQADRQIGMNNLHRAASAQQARNQLYEHLPELFADLPLTSMSETKKPEDAISDEAST